VAEPEPFLLHPSSAAFLAGDKGATRQRLAQRRDILDGLLVVGLLAVFLFLGVTLARAGQELAADANPAGRVPALLLGLVLLAVGVYLQVRRVRDAAARQRLVDAGLVLAARVIACRYTEGEPAVDEHGQEKFGYRIEIDYRFTTPAGTEIRDRDETFRDDLGDAPLPDEDAPVLVLYLDDGHYALL
jgi:hypothetical protein